MLSNELLDIIACPICKGGLQLANDSHALLCVPCGVRFQIKDGIPILLADEGIKIGESGPGSRDW